MKKCLLVGDFVRVSMYPMLRCFVGRVFVIVGVDEFRNRFTLRDLQDDSHCPVVHRCYILPVTSYKGVCNG